MKLIFFSFDNYGGNQAEQRWALPLGKGTLDIHILYGRRGMRFFYFRMPPTFGGCKANMSERIQNFVARMGTKTGHSKRPQMDCSLLHNFFPKNIRCRLIMV